MLTTLTILSRDQGNIHIPSRDQYREQAEPLNEGVVEPTNGRWKLRNIARTIVSLPSRLLLGGSSRACP
ncbi:hypothetical protein ABIA16_005332 [Sinorhizobium fredii]